MGIDYTAYSDYDGLTYDTATVDEVPTVVEEPVEVDEVPTVVEEPVEVDEMKTTEAVSEDSKIIKVDNAKKVYIRDTPSKDGNQLTVVTKDSELMVIGASEIDNEGTLWHNVCTESGIEGYVMAKFTTE